MSPSSSRLSAAFVVASLLLIPSLAKAEVAIPCSATEAKCQRASVAVTKTERIPVDFDFDTGWLPANAAVQVRLLAKLHGRTHVAMAGTLDATWPEAVSLTPRGKALTGLLALDDGLVVKAQARFHVNIAGKDYDWVGDLPGIPNVDLSAKSEVKFDPWAYGGATTSGITPQVTLAQVPITNSIIPIPGIEGGFQLEGAAEFSATYKSTRLVFDEIGGKGSSPDVNVANPFSRLLLSPTKGFDSTLTVHGELTRGMKVHFIPGFYFTLLGKKFELEIADIPLALPNAAPKAWVFDPVSTHVPLPRIDAPAVVDLGKVPLDKPTVATIALSSFGEERLILDAEGEKAIVLDAPHRELASGASDVLRATISPTIEGPVEYLVKIVSNDPFSPDTVVRIRAEGSRSLASGPNGDGNLGADVGEPSGCGCFVTSTGASQNLVLGGLPLFGLALLLRRRRRTPEEPPTLPYTLIPK